VTLSDAATKTGNMVAAKAPPERWRSPSTIRLVRLDPGNRTEAALAKKTARYKKAVSSVLRRRAASTRTGVRKATAVSRLSTAVTTATRTAQEARRE